MTVAQVIGEVVVAGVMLGGTFFMVVTGIGLLRFPDVYSRMHAAGKAGTVGVALLILAPTIFFATTDVSVTVRGVMSIVFQCLTTPGATYLIAHAAYVNSYPQHGRTDVDELKDWLPTYSDEDLGHE